MLNNKTSKGGIGRPLGFSKNKLIHEVTELFWTHGYNNLSLSAIAQKIGLTRSSLYNSFKTKEQLFTECLKYYADNSPTKYLKKYTLGEDVGPLLRKVFDEISALRANDKLNRGCLVANTFSELASRDSDLAKNLQEHNEERQKNMIHLIRHAISQNELPQDTDPEIIAHIILSFMSGLSMHAKKGASKTELQNMSRVFLEKIGFSNSVKLCDRTNFC